MRNIFKKKYSSTYIKMLLCIILIIDITLLLFASVMYNYYKIASKKEVDSLNSEIVSVVQNNIEYMSELVDNYVMSEFYREDTSKLMNAKTAPGDYEANTIMNRITATKQLQSMLHSVGIYNGNLDKVYSVDSALRENTTLTELISDPSLKAFKPYPMQKDVLTYIIYKGKNAKGKPDGAMIVNVKLDWLKTLIKSNNIDYTNMYLLDRQGNIVIDVNEGLVSGERLDRTYTDELINIKKTKDNKIYIIKEKHISAAYSLIPSLDMIFVIERDYDTLYRGVNRIGGGTVGFTLLFLLIGVGVSFFAGDKVYAPIRELINSLRVSFDKDNDYYDDLEYLENVMIRLKGGTELANTLTKTNMMREFLTNPAFFNNEMREDYIKDEEFFDGESEYYMLILDTIQKEEDVKRYLVKQLMARLGAGLHVDKSETETIIVLKGRPNPAALTFIEKELEDFGGTFVFVGESVSDPSQLAYAYERAKTLSKYRVLFENVHCLSEEKINMDERAENNSYPTEEQDALLESCKIGTAEEMDKCFEAFLNKIICFTYENYCMALMRITFLLMEEYPFLTDNNLQKTVFVTSDIEEVKSTFHDAFAVIWIKNNSARSMNKSVVDSMKEYIEMNISSFELCSKSLAMEFNMSTVYVNRVFRESEQMSIADYITDIRMKTAVKLLTSTTISVTEIMEKVGYDNKSKFYRHFRQYYGSTPREYRVEHFEVGKINNE